MSSAGSKVRAFAVTKKTISRRKKAGAKPTKASATRAKKPTARGHAAGGKRKAAGKIKSSLTKAQREEFRQMLLEKRQALVGDMGGIEAETLKKSRQESSGDLSSMPTHPADIGTDNYEHEFSLELLESERVLLEEIDEALERINKGTYGICLVTGEPISEARLRAKPWAKYTIKYARMLEKGLVSEEQGAKDNL